jgi:choline dehydrogenase-like flavoprotein
VTAPVPEAFRERADVAVVGTGAGGAVVAAELAEAGLDVVRGGRGPRPP